MQGEKQICNSLFHIISRTRTAALAMAIVFALAIIATPTAQAQTFTVIHNFTNGGDGGQPVAGLTIDAAGNLYGTTYIGGAYNSGIAFELRHSGSGWVLTPLHTFGGVARNDGACPWGRILLAQDGTLYGTTAGGGQPTGCFVGNNCDTGCGTVFHLAPSLAAAKATVAPWNETVVHRFAGGSDGSSPSGALIFDQSGTIYGTTEFGGSTNWGTIYKLMPSGSEWTESILHSFIYMTEDGAAPIGGVTFDQAGNLYGTTFYGGDLNCEYAGCGVVFQLSPSGSSWIEQTLHAFNGGSDGAYSYGGVIIDPSGNLYGTANQGGTGGGGTVFDLTPVNGGGWNFNTLYTFLSLGGGPSGPGDTPAMDAAGNLYGTTYLDGAYFFGAVFKLTPSNGGWTYTSLHDFTGGSDGAGPISNVVFDVNGNLYGTTSEGGAYGYGVVWEITP